MSSPPEQNKGANAKGRFQFGGVFQIAAVPIFLLFIYTKTQSWFVPLLLFVFFYSDLLALFVGVRLFKRAIKLFELILTMNLTLAIGMLILISYVMGAGGTAPEAGDEQKVLLIVASVLLLVQSFFVKQTTQFNWVTSLVVTGLSLGAASITSYMVFEQLMSAAAQRMI